MTKLGLRLHMLFAVLLISVVPILSFAQDEAAAPTATDGDAESATGNESAADSPDAESTAESGETIEEGFAEEGESAEDGIPEGAAEVGAPASGEAGEGAATESADIDGDTYRVRLRDLEQRVDELKEQIRRSHTRLSLLSDTILAGATGGARAEIEFVNDLSGAWHLVEAVFVLDGAVQYKKTDDTGVLAKQRTIPIFSGSVPTGDHTLQVLLKLRGHGFGVFSYLRGIEASVKSDHSFTISDGKVLELRVTAWEKGGPTTPVEEQPDIRFSNKVRAAADTPRAAPAKSSTAPAASGTVEKSDQGAGGKVELGGSSGKK